MANLQRALYLHSIGQPILRRMVEFGNKLQRSFAPQLLPLTPAGKASFQVEGQSPSRSPSLTLCLGGWKRPKTPEIRGGGSIAVGREADL